MFDARIFIPTLQNIRNILVEKKADFKGEYVIRDVIYRSKNTEETLGDVFLRLRLLPKNIWDGKSVIVSVKNTNKMKIGKQSEIPFKKEFDTEGEARDFIDKHWLDKFEYSFEFNRVGWQYDLGEDQIDLEDVESYYSVEFKSKTEGGLQSLLELFKVNTDEVIRGPSVVTIKEILDR